MPETHDRQLAVILHADVIGSTQLVQLDESLAHHRMVDLFQRFSRSIAESGGTVHEIRGDALLATFSRASDALTTAADFLQKQSVVTAEVADRIRPELRIGIAMGEVIIADGTMTGPGVVVAQRLEQLAGAGSIIIQGAAYETLPRHLPFQFENLGDQKLKGFDDTIRAFRVAPVAPTTPADPPGQKPVPANELSEIEKPSIAVLPFANRSNDPEQEYFSDGISEDIITELSRFHTLFVIARNSSFQFKGKNVDIQEVGQKLGVQYVVEGSVRRSGNRVRITAQLVDSGSGNHIWADRYDRELEDIFEVQDEVTRSIAAVLPGRVQEDVVSRVSHKPTENMKAYELMLQGKAFRDLLSVKGNAEVRRCCEKAIELDPRYARAYMYLSDSYIVDFWLGVASPDAQEQAMLNARKAIELDSNDVYIQDHLGYAHLCCGLWREAEVQINKTVANIVNEAESLAWCGYAYLLLDKQQDALDIVLKAVQLDPLHPPAMDWVLGQVFYFEEKYDEVVNLLYGKALLNSLAHAFVTAAHARLGNQNEMHAALQTFIVERRSEFASRDIKVSADNVESLAGAYRVMWRNPSSWEHLADGLRLAGLPN